MLERGSGRRCQRKEVASRSSDNAGSGAAERAGLGVPSAATGCEHRCGRREVIPRSSKTRAVALPSVLDSESLGSDWLCASLQAHRGGTLKLGRGDEWRC